jgi:hypothetical protein
VLKKSDWRIRMTAKSVSLSLLNPYARQSVDWRKSPVRLVDGDSSDKWQNSMYSAGGSQGLIPGPHFSGLFALRNGVLALVYND